MPNFPLSISLGFLAIATTCPAQTPNWTRVTPRTSPKHTVSASTVYDSARRRVVLFGGLESRLGGQLSADTWEWDGGNWTLIKSTNAPPARYYAAMAYDSVRQRTVLFGGANFRGMADTWEWDGRNWMQIKSTNPPPARYGHSMAYDSVRQRTVLYGGSAFRPMADTWEWDGRNWTQITPSTYPSARYAHAMAYDSARRRTVLFGGYDRNSTLDETWEYDGKNWSRLNPTTTPGPASLHTLVYDCARQRTVLFGRNGTLEWDGVNWTRIKPVISPPGIMRHSMAYDSVRQRIVQFGGWTMKCSLCYSAETWEYGIPTLTLTANTPTISISNGGTQILTLNAGADLKNKSYWIFGSATSTMPGIVLTGIHIPLVPDIYTTIALGAVNTTVFTKFMGPLSATGTATASLNVPTGLPNIPFTLVHAYVVYDGTTGQIFTSSNPVSVEFK